MVLRSPLFQATAAELVRAGGERVALHLRGRGLTGREMWEITGQTRKTSAEAGAWLLVNDRLDVAMAAGADGVQLGGDSFSIADARRVIPKEMLVGTSVHDTASAEEAVQAGADFLIAGTLYESRSHPGRPGSGCDWLSGLKDLGSPIIGIGGITVERVAEVCGAGAYGVAVISGIWDADHPAGELERYLRKLEE